MCLDLHQNWGLGLVPLNKFKPSSDLFTDRSKPVLLL